MRKATWVLSKHAAPFRSSEVGDVTSGRDADEPVGALHSLQPQPSPEAVREVPEASGYKGSCLPAWTTPVWRVAGPTWTLWSWK